MSERDVGVVKCERRWGRRVEGELVVVGVGGTGMLRAVVRSGWRVGERSNIVWRGVVGRYVWVGKRRWICLYHWSVDGVSGIWMWMMTRS